jgi:hypothetical protein
VALTFGQGVWRNPKTPNKACSRLVGFCAVFEHFSGFGLFLLPSRIHARPPAANANRWAQFCAIKSKGDKVMKKSIGLMFLLFVLLTVLTMGGCAPAPTPEPTATAMPHQDVSLNDFFGGNLYYKNYPFILKIPEGFASVGGANYTVTWLADADAKELATNHKLPETGNFFITGTSTDSSYDKITDTFSHLPNKDTEISAYNSLSGLNVLSVEKRTTDGHPLLFMKSITPESLGIKGSPYMYFVYIATPQITDVVLYVIYFSAQDEKVGNQVWELFKSSFNAR